MAKAIEGLEKEKSDFANTRISDADYKIFNNWLIDNQGEQTFLSYMQLRKDEQERIYSFISNMPIEGKKLIAGQKYLFVHSRPEIGEKLDDINASSDGLQVMWFKNIEKEQIHHMLWTRDEKDPSDSYKKYKENGFTVICGHTPSENGVIVDLRKEKGFIRIDAGCSHGCGKLALYCIEKDSVEYICPKELPYQDVDDR